MSDDTLRDIQDTLTVMAGIQARQAQALKEHAQWLEDHDLTMKAVDERLDQISKNLELLSDLILKGRGGNGR